MGGWGGGPPSSSADQRGGGSEQQGLQRDPRPGMSATCDTILTHRRHKCTAGVEKRGGGAFQNELEGGAQGCLCVGIEDSSM